MSTVFKHKLSAKPTKAVATKPAAEAETDVTWGPWSAVIVAVVVFLAAEIIGTLLVSIYPFLKHWTGQQSTDWLNNSVNGQFFFYLMAEGLTVASILCYIHWRKGTFRAIGLRRPKWEDIAYALIGLLIYLPILIIAVVILQQVFHGLNLNQQQAIGFSQSTTGWPLLLVFFSLVVFPPIAEEILFRGFVYSGLKKALPKVWAVLLTCAVFAFPHLLESTGGGPLWVAGIDTFVLSLTLIWLREQTGRLYAGMGLHALKNFIAFVQLYPIFHIH